MMLQFMKAKAFNLEYLNPHSWMITLVSLEITLLGLNNHNKLFSKNLANASQGFWLPMIIISI